MPQQPRELATQSVLLIDDHPVVALGLRLAFQERRRYVLAATAQAPDRALSLIDRMRPDAIVLDLVFAGTITLNTITSCREAAAQTAIVVFSSLPSRLYEQQALDAGADAYVTKENDLSGLVDVLDAIVSSGSAGTRGVAEPRAGAGQQLLLGDVYFTPREVEVGHLLSRGYSISRIADEIGVSSNTVAAHRDNIRRKLDCRDTGELIARLARIFEAPRSQ